MKALIVVMLLAVLGALASAGVFMLRKPRKPGESDPAMARALGLRVGLSIALFLCILLAWKLGWIQPGGLPISP